MPNKLQKLLFSLSSASPVIIFFALTWYIQKKDLMISCIAGSIGILLSIYVIAFVIICKKIVAPVNISIDKITSNDIWVIGYILGYLMPFTSIVFSDFNPKISGTLAFMICLLLPATNIVMPNPILLIFLKYHFYSVETVSGASGYCLLSRKKQVPNKKIINKVYCVFEYLLIEKEVE